MITSPNQSDLLQHPRKYQQPHFINRMAELQIIENQIRQAQAGDIIPEPVINFWGVGGIGKTWLLQHLYHLYQYHAEPTTTPAPLERPTCALLYSFPDEPTTVFLPALIESLADQILAQLSSVLSAQEQDLLIQAKEEASIEDLIRSLEELSRRYAPLILLDNTEKVSSDDWQNLEVRLIEPLVINGRVLIVLAGRRQVPRWRRFEVRRRVMEPDRTQVRAFNRTQVTNQIDRHNYRIPTDLLFPYTAGNPLLVDALAERIRDQTKGKKPTQKWFDRHQNELLKILRAYEEYILEKVPLSLRRILYTVSPLRCYRLEALRFMLYSQEITTKPQPDGYYLKILHELDQQTEVVWWSHEHRAYVTDETVRQVMNRRQLLENGKNYMPRHDQALQMYWGWAKEHPETSEDFIIEIWFHLASMALAEKDLPHLYAEAKNTLDFAREKLTPDRLLVLQMQLEKGDPELIDLLPGDLRNELCHQLHQTLGQSRIVKTSW